MVGERVHTLGLLSRLVPSLIRWTGGLRPPSRPLTHPWPFEPIAGGGPNGAQSRDSTHPLEKGCNSGETTRTTSSMSLGSAGPGAARQNGVRCVGWAPFVRALRALPVGRYLESDVEDGHLMFAELQGGGGGNTVWGEAPAPGVFLGINPLIERFTST